MIAKFTKSITILAALSAQLLCCDVRSGPEINKPKLVMIEKVSAKDFDSAVNSVVIEGLKQDGHLSTELLGEKFDHFYDVVVKAIQPYGSFSEGGFEDADFSSSRYVDPSRRLIVTSAISLDGIVLNKIADQLQILEGLHVVVFDGIDGQHAVFSNGRIIKEEK